MKLVKDLRGHMHVKDMLTGKKKKVMITTMLAMAMSLMTCTLAFAGDTSATTDFSKITTAITGKLSVAEVAAIIAAIIGAGMAFVIMWWGARKLVSSLIMAFKKGKLKL